MSPTRMPWKQSILFPLAGLLMSGGYAPVSIWWMLPLGIALWAKAVMRSRRTFESILGSLLTSSVFFLIVLHWSSIYVGWFPWVVLALFESLFLAPVGLGIWMFRKNKWLPLFLGGIFVLDEAIRSRVPWGGFGWARLAFVEPSYFTKYAAIGGAPLLTLLIGLLAGLLVTVLNPGSRRSSLVSIALILIIPLVLPTMSAEHQVNVAAIQGNVPRLGLDFNAQREAVLQNHADTTRKLALDIRGGEAPQPSLVVWPENASDVDPIHDPHAKALISQITDEINVPILVGGVSERPSVQNISVLWLPQLGPTSIYIKQHLAPFGEYLPLRALAEKLVPTSKRIIDMTPGVSTVTHKVGQIRLADVICFEIIEDQLVRNAIKDGKANLLAVQTNSATFGRSAESTQQLAVSRMRAIEHGRAIVSASTSGKSALIAPSGEVIRVSSFFTSEILQADLPLVSELTWSDRLGSWPESVIIAFVLSAIILRFARAGKK